MKVFNDNELIKKWNSINYFDGGSFQLDVEHPLDWFVLYTTKVNKSLATFSRKPVKIKSSKSIDASCNQRHDGKYMDCFTLLNQD